MLIFMLNERKSEKAAGAGAAYSAPPDPLAVTGGARPLPYPPPLVNIVIRPPPPEILDPPLNYTAYISATLSFIFPF